MEILAIAYRKNNNISDATTSLEKIYDLDPLHHIIPYEKYLTITNYENKELVINSHRSELAYQTYLELAISYYNRGLIDEAIKLLELGPNESINKIWESFLIKDKDKLKGFDRVVPIGKALEMDMVWDGYQLPYALSRIIN